MVGKIISVILTGLVVGSSVAVLVQIFLYSINFLSNIFRTDFTDLVNQQHFSINELVDSSLSKNRVFEEVFDEKNKGNIDHISLSRWADLIMVLPATANFMSRLSKGSADDLSLIHI